VEALKRLFAKLPGDYPLPFFITIHRDENDGGGLLHLLQCFTPIKFSTPDDKEPIRPNHAYLAPGGYHLQIEGDFTFSLSTDPPVHYCRPSVDVMFETAARAYGPELIGIVLSGANEDGAKGIRTIKEYGGTAIVESPETARFKTMPKAALTATRIDHVLHLDEIAVFLVALGI
jgi:two-component system chemotaxis response regulator CheB